MYLISSDLIVYKYNNLDHIITISIIMMSYRTETNNIIMRKYV